MRKSIRAVGIVIKDEKVLLMWRKNNGREYYTFPGGGVEDNESVEEAVIREFLEETSIKVSIQKLLYHHHLISKLETLRVLEDSDQYFFLCDYVSGEPILASDSEEKLDVEKGENLYNPLWVEINDLNKFLLYPLEIRDWLIEDIKDNFKQTPKEASLYIKDLRQIM